MTETDAACRDWNPEWWFADDPAVQMGAKRICRECPVKVTCAEIALEREGQTSAKYRFGIWGGLDPAERYVIAVGPTRGTAECGTESGYHRHRRMRQKACADCRAAHAAGNQRRRAKAEREDVA